MNCKLNLVPHKFIIGMATPSGSRLQLKPPERGIFPLDHDGECKPLVELFLNCLKDNKNDHFYCRESSKAYLKCRMDKNLMKSEDLSNLGLGEKAEYVRVVNDDVGKKEKEGFLAGLGVSGSNKGGFLSWNKIPPKDS